MLELFSLVGISCALPNDCVARRMALLIAIMANTDWRAYGAFFGVGGWDVRVNFFLHDFCNVNNNNDDDDDRSCCDDDDDDDDDDNNNNDIIIYNKRCL